MSTERSPVRDPSATRREDPAPNNTKQSPAKNSKVIITPRRQQSYVVPHSRSLSVKRLNKIYFCPPTPPPDVQYDREQCFVLDCNAVSNISQDYSTANPKLGSVIPPYDAQCDHQVDNYFRFFNVSRTLQKTGQYNPHESIGGRVYDRFNSAGHGYRYLSLRNKFGSGHSIDQIRGHELFMSDPKSIVNYNGLFGYRRNTPSLRYQPTIGTKRSEKGDIVPHG